MNEKKGGKIMSDLEKRITELEDKFEIQQALNRYVTGLDTKNMEMYLSAFDENAHLDMQSWGESTGIAAIEEGVKGTWASLPKTNHVAGNFTLLSYDGQTATCRSIVVSFAWAADDSDLLSYAAYNDTLRKKDDGTWVICDRIFDTRFTGDVASLWGLVRA